jgi:hypothetical protein
MSRGALLPRRMFSRQPARHEGGGECWSQRRASQLSVRSTRSGAKMKRAKRTAASKRAALDRRVETDLGSLGFAPFWTPAFQ